MRFFFNILFAYWGWLRETSRQLQCININNPHISILPTTEHLPANNLHATGRLHVNISMPEDTTLLNGTQKPIGSKRQRDPIPTGHTHKLLINHLLPESHILALHHPGHIGHGLDDGALVKVPYLQMLLPRSHQIPVLIKQHLVDPLGDFVLGDHAAVLPGRDDVLVVADRDEVFAVRGECHVRDRAAFIRDRFCGLIQQFGWFDPQVVQRNCAVFEQVGDGEDSAVGGGSQTGNLVGAVRYCFDLLLSGRVVYYYLGTTEVRQAVSDYGVMGLGLGGDAH